MALTFEFLVPNLDLCEDLKTNGLPQSDWLLYWWESENGKRFVSTAICSMNRCEKVCAAPMLSEMILLIKKIPSARMQHLPSLRIEDALAQEIILGLCNGEITYNQTRSVLGKVK
jgi:hypothetical protein